MSNNPGFYLVRIRSSHPEFVAPGDQAVLPPLLVELVFIAVLVVARMNWAT